MVTVEDPVKRAWTVTPFAAVRSIRETRTAYPEAGFAPAETMIYVLSFVAIVNAEATISRRRQDDFQIATARGRLLSEGRENRTSSPGYAEVPHTPARRTARPPMTYTRQFGLSLMTPLLAKTCQ